MIEFNNKVCRVPPMATTWFVSFCLGFPASEEQIIKRQTKNQMPSLFYRLWTVCNGLNQLQAGLHLMNWRNKKPQVVHLKTVTWKQSLENSHLKTLGTIVWRGWSDSKAKWDKWSVISDNSTSDCKELINQGDCSLMQVEEHCSHIYVVLAMWNRDRLFSHWLTFHFICWGT